MKYGQCIIVAVTLFSTACGTMRSAAQVGGAEPATWVFVQMEGGGLRPGIYRCTDGNKQPVCYRARLEDATGK